MASKKDSRTPALDALKKSVDGLVDEAVEHRSEAELKEITRKLNELGAPASAARKPQRETA
jgi:hypothetical protein